MVVWQSHLRRALYPIELDCAPTTVCMTGANGYVGSAITERLLAMGHSVHAAVIDAQDEKALAHLRELPGSENLSFFTANLQKKGDYDAPMLGCEYVIHNASPMILVPPKGKERQLVVEPAVEGLINVLETVDRCATVKRVVITSSVTAIVGDHGERGPDHIYTEADWNLTSRDDYCPYHRSKTLAEQKAWEMAAGKKWDLIAICPSVIMGPPMTKMRCESVLGFLRQTVRCVTYPLVPPLGWAYVDIADTAAAHTLAMLTPGANGRYIIDSEGLNALELGQLLLPEYSHLKIPYISMPYWMTWLGIRLFPKLAGTDVPFLKCTYNKVPKFDTSKARRELGIQFFPVKKTLLDMTAALIKQGMVRVPKSP